MTGATRAFGQTVGLPHDAAMTSGLLLAFMGFAFVCSITLGPNNAMLLASGLNFGFRRTVPHMLGISFGTIVMLLLVGLGLGEIFVAVPALYIVLRYAGAAYLLWLAWKIAHAGPVEPGRSGGRPMNAFQAIAFQWINPKAWIMVIGAVSTYAPRGDFTRNVAMMALVMGVVNLPSVCVWAVFGTALRPLLANPGRVRLFNLLMASLLVLSLVPILME
jgi:threonine/homoserine/homoserine lactone efflux protein